MSATLSYPVSLLLSHIVGKLPSVQLMNKRPLTKNIAPIADCRHRPTLLPYVHVGIDTEISR